MVDAERLDLAALAISTETAADLLAARGRGQLTVTLSGEEVRTIAERLYRLAAVTRVLHNAKVTP